MKQKKLIKRFAVEKPDRFRLSDHDPAYSGGFGVEKDMAKTILTSDIKRLSELQERLYAQERWATLLILQGMDAAGKDAVIKHVMTGINPLGCDVHAFKTPNSEELNHDFLWRTNMRLPERGRIGIFNRSYYEEVLIVRVHPEILAKEKLPRDLVTKNIWKQRFKDIRSLERYLVRNGTLILKFFLNMSREEQRRRLLARLDEPAKRWKFSSSDIKERSRWDDYMAAYEAMIKHTSTEEAPWHIIPADHKWFAQMVVASTIVEALDNLNIEFPKVEGPALEEMNRVRDALLEEGTSSISLSDEPRRLIRSVS